MNIFGEPMQVRAEVSSLNELSAHADQQELVKWIRPIAQGLKGIFLVHGEPTAQTMLAAVLKDQFDIPVICPTRGQSFQLTPFGPAA